MKLIARHVRAGPMAYQSLFGSELRYARSWNGRISSVEDLLTRLTVSFRKLRFRSFRPLGAGEYTINNDVMDRLTAIRDIKGSTIIPWRLRNVNILFCIDVQGIKLVRRTLNENGIFCRKVVYDLTVNVSAGIAMFKKNQWKTISSRRFNSLISEYTLSILSTLEECAVSS